MTVPEAPTEEAANPDEPEAAVEEKRKDPTRTAIEWAAIIVAALAAAFLIKTFAVQAFYIPSASMDPTLKISDRVLVNKLSYNVDRGALIVFKRPPGADTGDPNVKDLIKRVIGLPGDKVEGKDGKVWVNDKPLDESYLPQGVFTADFSARTVPPDHYFMMGDNRFGSRDSRHFGPIAKKLVVGRAFVRVWPPTSVKRL